jgi:hypothetical protein
LQEALLRSGDYASPQDGRLIYVCTIGRIDSRDELLSLKADLEQKATVEASGEAAEALEIVMGKTSPKR